MNSLSKQPKKRWFAVGLALVLISALVAGAATRRQWMPQVARWMGKTDDHSHDNHSHSHDDHSHSHDDHSHGNESHGHSHDHGDHSHDHEGHDDSTALELSAVAWKNIGLKTAVVELGAYVKTVSVPAMVVERPGRSQVEVPAHLTGIVTRVYPMEGEAIQPGQPLFDLRLTHEDLVTAQREYLQSAQALDVVKREIARMQEIGEGVIAGRRILEQKYEQEKIEAALHAQRQGLLLHGLAAGQIDEILETRTLIPQMTVRAPPYDEDSSHDAIEHVYHVQEILVKRGQSVTAEQSLAVLADHCLLYVEGLAFEDDSMRLVQIAKEGRTVEIAPVGASGSGDAMALKIYHVADRVDQTSRSLKFYMELPNEIIRDEMDRERRFVTWQFRPGQRMEIRIPIGKPWTNQIILPPAAVVSEGAEEFVFERNGGHFDRVPVHVVHRDKDAIVIDNDGKLLGKTVAISGAYEMHLALKTKSGGGVDPHAGHSH